MAPSEAVADYLDSVPTRPASTRRPDLDGLGAYAKLVRGMLQLSDSDTMDDDAITGMRRAYFANVSIIDTAVGRIIDALESRGLLDDTWIVYTSDHGEMGGNHGLMPKCLLYEPAVRIPLIIRPPGRCDTVVVGQLIEQIDIPATIRDIASAPTISGSDGRSLLGYLADEAPEPRDVSISEKWCFASFETTQHRLVVDEDRHSPCQLFDLSVDPAEDDNLVLDHSEIVAELMSTIVEPFLAVAPSRPHPSPFG